MILPRILIIASIALIATACSAPATQSPEIIPPTTSTSVPAVAYTLSPGDTVTINFTYTPERDQNQIIRPDGNISLPVINDVRAAGLTTDGLRLLLIKRYTTGGDLKNPDIIVTVQAYGGNRIFVGGEVSVPGPVALLGPTTAYQAILLAQGFKVTARRSDVILVHQNSDGSTISRVLDLKSPTATGDGSGAVAVQPHDILFVPKTGIANADVAVDQYVRQLLPISPSVSATP